MAKRAFALVLIMSFWAFRACPARADSIVPNLFTMDSGAPITSLAAWETRRAELLAHLETEQYGHALDIPQSSMTLVSSQSAIDPDLHARVTDLVLEFGEVPGKPRLIVNRFEPVAATADTEILVVTDDCARDNIFGLAPLGSHSNPNCDDLIKDYTTGVIEGVARGLSFAFVQVTRVFPDSALDYPKSIAPWVSPGISPGDTNSPGALMAWASLVRAVRAFESVQHPGIQSWVMGFSRFGKTAALALAIDDGFAGGVLHMSGSLGTTLSRGNGRETLASIARNFPHWINASLQKNPDPSHLSTDQHALVALSEPRPLLVDDGDLDFWSNPSLSVRSTELASVVGTRFFACAPLLELDSGDAAPIFDRARCLVHKYFLQPHSLLAGNWDFILDFVSAGR